VGSAEQRNEASVPPMTSVNVKESPMSRPHRSLTAWLTALLLVVTAGVAAAQDHAGEAEQLFREGKRLMKENKLAEACTAFETSNRLDPSVATLMNLADCREKNGQIQSAWTAFLESERQLRNDKKQAALHKTAKDRATKLEGRLSYLTVSVARDNAVDGLTLTRNGEPFDEGLWNTAIPVDGGTYVIGGRAPAHEEWSTTVTVPAEGGHITVDVPKFKEVEVLVEPPPDDGTGDKQPPPDDKVVVVEHAPSSFTGQRKLGVAVGAVGLLAVGAGALLWFQGNDLAQQADDLCHGQMAGCADAAEANALVARGDKRVLYANISFGVGAAAIIGAAVLWFTGGPDHAASHTALAPVITPTSGGFALTGSF
jgi:hypothetical protein